MNNLLVTPDLLSHVHTALESHVDRLRQCEKRLREIQDATGISGLTIYKTDEKISWVDGLGNFIADIYGEMFRLEMRPLGTTAKEKRRTKVGKGRK